MMGMCAFQERTDARCASMALSHLSLSLSLGGETLSRVPQKIPGGLFGMSLQATIELAEPASEIGISKNNLVNEEGTAIVLPVRMRLENPLLGSECYVGSRSSPIVLHLTTGRTNPDLPNKTIDGTGGRLQLTDNLEIVGLAGPVLVDNSFSMPGATGCGGAGEAPLVDSMIDHVLGLPSPDGYNTIVENNRLKEASIENVITHEGE